MKQKRVALLIESSRAYGRGLLQGIANYNRTHGNWSIYHEERSLGDAVPDWLLQFSGDGMIARAESKTFVQSILNQNIPVVDLRGRFHLPGVPLIETNDQQVIEMAWNHLQQRGFCQFAFCGFSGADYSESRKRYYQEMIQANQLQEYIYEGPALRAGSHLTTIETKGILQEEAIMQWIDGLPTPIGVIGCNDYRSQQVLNACNAMQVKVPDDVAVIGVDNDEIICEMSGPSLSSVEPNTHKIGYDAAMMLQQMMAGNTNLPARTFVSPTRIITRRSTDVLAVSDVDVANALQFIRDHACDDIGVLDIVKHISISRSSLEQRFAKLLDRSPNEEINRVRIHRVKQLLLDTDYKLSTIAQMCGFRHPEYMSALFRQKTGQAPGEFRKQNQSNLPR